MPPPIKFVCCSVCRTNFQKAEASRRQQLADLCSTCILLPQAPPTQTVLRILLNYDPETGALTYARDFPRRKKGALATYTAGQGYLNVYVAGNQRAHRMIWLMQTGELPELIDHINHDRSDNRWSNLRATNSLGNATNRFVQSNNRAGLMGVRQVTGRQNYRAEIMVNGKTKHIGTFATKEAASEAYQMAAKSLGFHRNHGGGRTP